MRQFKTVLKFEYTNYVKSKGYIGITAFMLVIILVVTNVPYISGIFKNVSEAITGTSESGENGGKHSGDEIKKAIIADTQNIYADEILAAYIPGYEWTRVSESGFTESEDKIENGEYELAVLIDGLRYQIYEKGGNMLTGGSQGKINAMIRTIYQSVYLTTHGLNAEEADEFLNAYPFGEYNTVGKDYTQSFWLSYAVLMLMYMVILMYGQFVSTSVVTEKTTKAMELLITSAKPFQLMFGKVIGVGAAGLTQFGLIIVAALGLFRLNYNSWAEFSPTVAAILEMSASAGLIVYAILYFILGFFSFAFIYAGFASTVSRMEDANSALMLPMMLFVSAFLVAIFGSMNPEAGFVRVCSFVPFLSPLVMFMRICVTEMPFIEIAVSLVINIVTVFGSAFVCSRIYKVGVMLYGKKPNIKDIIKYAVKA